MQRWEFLTVAATTLVQHQADDTTNYTQGLRVNGQDTPAPEDFYQYLDQLGDQGWELVSVDGGEYYFKRPKS